MSFLNPVNEPVLRFKSTDAGAPQINYSVRTAGDVKAVLKACLVTGYGATASAGWTAVNEVGNVIEFLSPSAAMSDYRLGIDDTLTTATTWYYQYQDARVNPVYNAPVKALGYIVSPHVNNGWQLLVTQRGICLIEMVQSSAVSNQVSRITWWGQVKSALVGTLGKNMSFWCAGYGSPANLPSNVFQIIDTYRHCHLGAYTSLSFASANMDMIKLDTKVYGVVAAELVDGIYLRSLGDFIAKQPAFYLQTIVSADNLYGVTDTTLNGRPVIKACLSYSDSREQFVREISRVVLVSLDYWEY